VLVDQELWMFPPLLQYHPQVARTLLSSRVNTFKGAMANAQKAGIRGIMYPFESASTGIKCFENLILNSSVLF
jgi:trehalose/maltose hydrolase-like predicted phosphorylase